MPYQTPISPPRTCVPPRARRQVLLSILVLTWLPAVGGCDRKPLNFNSVDITGASYGATLSELQDPSGRSRSIREFEGRVVAVFFGFTSCPDICPSALAKLKEVKNLLGKDGNRFVAILVTIDPEQDQPAMLGAYVSAFDPEFIALRGDAVATRAVARDFKVFYEKVPTGPQSYTMSHSTGMFVFDDVGRVRLYSRHEDPAPLLLDDVRKLLAQRRG